MSGVDQQPRPQAEEQETPASSIDWALRGQCVVIIDRNDGATIILEPEEAEQLREWLARTL